MTVQLPFTFVTSFEDVQQNFEKISQVAMSTQSTAGQESSTATAGGGAAVPATVKGFLVLQDHTGATIKVPYFAA